MVCYKITLNLPESGGGQEQRYRIVAAIAVMKG